MLAAEFKEHEAQIIHIKSQTLENIPDIKSSQKQS